MVFIYDTNDGTWDLLERLDAGDESALAELIELAESGNKNAIDFVGMYLSNEGKDDSAMKWLVAASEFGSETAAWNLAMIARERGDREGVRRWIDRADELGKEDAKDVIAMDYEVDTYLEIFRLSLQLDEGDESGVPRLVELAEAGNKKAIQQVGYHFSRDPDNHDKAIEWLLLSNGFGSKYAAWNLAMIALDRESAEDARRWIDRAADLGHEDAKEVISRNYDVDSVIEKYRE